MDFLTNPQSDCRFVKVFLLEKNESAFRPDEFIDVKGWKALGNKLTEYKIISIDAN